MHRGSPRPPEDRRYKPFFGDSFEIPKVDTSPGRPGNIVTEIVEKTPLIVEPVPAPVTDELPRPWSPARIPRTAATVVAEHVRLSQVPLAPIVAPVAATTSLDGLTATEREIARIDSYTDAVLPARIKVQAKKVVTGEMSRVTVTLTSNQRGILRDLGIAFI